MKKNLLQVCLTILSSCVAAVAWAIEPVDGIYQISSSQDLQEFAQIVNTDGRKHQFHAVVTQDFTVEGLVMVGAPSNAFAGSFDGQGHTITIHFDQQTTGYDGECGLFRRINGCTIRNLRVEGTIDTKGQCAGGIISGIWQNAVVENCVSAVTINDTNGGDGTHGGIVARISDKVSIVIRNCAFIGTINAPGRQGSGGILGWPDNGGTQVKVENCLMAGTLNLAKGQDNDVIVRNTATVTNCYYVDLQGMNNSKNATLVAEGQLASGELCYLLNNRQSDEPAWFQALGTDPMPLPIGTAVVYANGTLCCDGTPKEGSEVVYSNTDGSVRDDHHFNDWGFCEVCDKLQADYMSPAADGVFEIADNKQLNWFAAYVNEAEDKHINARLVADIDFSGQQIMIGNGDTNDAYAGTFDGQGHKVTLGYVASQKNVGLFRYLNNAVVRNLITDGTIRNENYSCAGGIFAGSRGASLIENCVSYVVFSRTSNGDATVGGIGAYMHDNGTLRNCAFLGSINTPSADGNGGLLGYANGGESVTIENCLVNASAFNVSGNSMAVVRNCNNLPNTYVVGHGSATAQGLSATEAQLTSGELCFLLNGSQSESPVWYQLIGTDAAPLPFAKEGAVVYTNGSMKCDGTLKDDVTFSNSESTMQIDDHSFTNGVCVVCGSPDEDYLHADAEGIYQLSEANDIVWFAAIVAHVNAAAKGALAADIDFNGIDFQGIGTPAVPYRGTFDGKNHLVSNLIIDLQFTEAPGGFFNEITAGAHIKDFTIDNSCYITGHHYVGAFVGHVSGNGSVMLEQLGNEAEVQAWFQNAGGILGCNTSGELKVTVLNCYNTGTISSERESGGISGWLGNNAVTTNCYNMGSVMGEGSESFARGNTIQITNCFDPVTDWPALPASPIDDFTNGTVYQKLSDAAPGIWFLSANEGGYPVLRNTGFATGIKEVSNEKMIGRDIYNLNGQKVEKARKGLYIIGGKKVVVRK